MTLDEMVERYCQSCAEVEHYKRLCDSMQDRQEKWRQNTRQFENPFDAIYPESEMAKILRDEMSKAEHLGAEVDRLRAADERAHKLAEYYAEKAKRVEAETTRELRSLRSALGANAGGWISVDERLPEKDGYYYVCDNIDGDGAIPALFTRGRFRHNDVILSVTHWHMPPTIPRQAC